jgi:proteasome lid subunit RPN8/RPN11
VVIFTDEVVAELGRTIAAHPPELGGALLGLPWSNVVTCFISDPAADVTPVSYLPTAALRARVREIESRSGLEFRGIVHSHPDDMNHPSSPDLRALEIGLASNPHLPSLASPIITVDRAAEPEDEAQLSLSPRGRLTCYVAARPGADTDQGTSWLGRRAAKMLRLTKTAVGVMPIDGDVAALVNGFRAEGVCVEQPQRDYRLVNGALFITRELALDTSVLSLLFPPHYPICAPLAFLARAGDAAPRQVEFTWALSNVVERLAGCRRATLEQLSTAGAPFSETNSADPTSQPKE